MINPPIPYSSLFDDYTNTINNLCLFNQNTCCHVTGNYDLNIETDLSKKQTKRGRSRCKKPVIVQMTIINDSSSNIMENVLKKSMQENNLIQQNYQKMKRNDNFSLRQFMIDHDIDIKVYSYHKIKVANRIGINIPKTISFSCSIKPRKYFRNWSPPHEELFFEIDFVQSTAQSSNKIKKESNSKQTKSPCPIQTIVPWDGKSKNFHNMYFDNDPPHSEYNKQKNEWSINIKVEADKVNYSEGCSYMFRFTCFHQKNNRKTELFRKFSSPFKCTSKALLDENLNQKIITMVHNNSDHSGSAEDCHICSNVSFQDYSKRLRDMHHLIASNMEVSTVEHNRNELARCSLIEMEVGTIQLDTLKHYIDEFFNFSTYEPLEFKDYFNNGTKSVQDIITSRIIESKIKNQTEEENDEQDIRQEDLIENDEEDIRQEDLIENDEEDIRQEDLIENNSEHIVQQDLNQQTDADILNFDEFNLIGSRPGYSLSPFTSILDSCSNSEFPMDTEQYESNDLIFLNNDINIMPTLSPLPQNNSSSNLVNDDHPILNETPIQNDPLLQNNPSNDENQTSDDYCIFNEITTQNDQSNKSDNLMFNEESDNIFNQYDLNQNNSYEYDEHDKLAQITIPIKKNIEIEPRKSPNTPTDGSSVQFNRLVNNLSKSNTRNKEHVSTKKVKKKRAPNPFIKLVRKFKKK